MRFGCHISIKNGYLAAAKAAVSLGTKAFQYFPKNPRSLRIKKFDHEDAERCAVFCRKHGMVSIAHAPYPTNLSASDGKLSAVMASAINDLEIAEACGSIGVVIHFGTYKGAHLLTGYERMIHALNEILKDWKGNSLILIENNAGKSGQLGTTLEELVKVRELTNHPNKIGFCFDTCHAFAAGLWNGKNWEDVVDRGRRLDYFNHLKVIHLNNSRYPAGSKRDRHANLRHGEIAVTALKTLITSPIVRDIPLILETPAINQSHDSEFHDLMVWGGS